MITQHNKALISAAKWERARAPIWGPNVVVGLAVVKVSDHVSLVWRQAAHWFVGRSSDPKRLGIVESDALPFDDSYFVCVERCWGRRDYPDCVQTAHCEVPVLFAIQRPSAALRTEASSVLACSDTRGAHSPLPFF